MLAPAAALALTAALAAGCAAPEPGVVGAGPYEPDSGTLAVKCGRLIDGVSDQPLTGLTILIDKGRIVEVGKEVRIPAGTPVLDLSAHTVLPGLIDMHTHLIGEVEDSSITDEMIRRPVEKEVEIGRKNALATLNAGFTTVRDVGVYRAWTDRALRDQINRGEAVGPRMQVAGFYLTIPGGGGDVLRPGLKESDIPAELRLGVGRGAEHFRRKTQEAIDGGADVIKLIASGAILAYGGVPGAPEMTPEEIGAAVEVAHAAGKKVAAHAHGAQSIREAILAGADSIEHASLIDAEGLRLARERGVALALDIEPDEYVEKFAIPAGWPQEFIDKMRDVLPKQRASLVAAYREGAPVVFATDSGTYPHGLNGTKLVYRVNEGMRPMDVIKSATSVAARAMGWEDRVGALAPGHFGDLIAVEGDPLADIRALEDVKVVVKGGLLFKSPS